MIQELLKDKKKIGILAILVIVIIISAITYLKSGFKELKKNETESIFVDNTEDTDTLVNKNNSAKKSSSTSNEGENVKFKDKRIVVEIKGEVKKPDVYMLDENSIIKDLIEAAGGLTENADLTNINRAKKLQNHDLIYITNKNEIAGEVQNSNGAETISSAKNGKGNSNKKVNINSATAQDLKTITGIGDAKAKSIIEYREKNGGFKTIDDIKNVTGIGEKMFERIKEQIET